VLHAQSFLKLGDDECKRHALVPAIKAKPSKLEGTYSLLWAFGSRVQCKLREAEELARNATKREIPRLGQLGIAGQGHEGQDVEMDDLSGKRIEADGNAGPRYCCRSY